MKKYILSIIALCIGYFVNGQTTSYSATGTSGTLGTNNSFFGSYAGSAANSYSSLNSFLGYNSGAATTSGTTNDAFGAYSLFSNTTETNSAAFGYSSLRSNTYGEGNTAFGNSAMYYNVTGNYNLAVGHAALQYNDTSNSSVAIGEGALQWNQTPESSDNTAVGRQSSNSVWPGYNTSIGYQALVHSVGLSSGVNTSIGALSLLSSTGSSFVEFGQSVAIGYKSGECATVNNKIMQNSIALGANTIMPAGFYVDNIAVIGNSSMTSIGGHVGWSTLSDGRFKTGVKEDVSGLKFITQLRPVSYTFDINAFNNFNKGGSSIDSISQSKNSNTSTRQVGFIAQEVEAAMQKTQSTFSGLDAPTDSKGYYKLRYEDFVVPLVKAVQELCVHKSALKKRIDSLIAKVNALISISRTNTVGIPSVLASNIATLNSNLVNSVSEDSEITMTLPQNIQVVTIVISDMQDVQLKSISVTDRGNVSIAIHHVELNAGIYQCSLIADGQTVDIKPMVLTD